MNIRYILAGIPFIFASSYLFYITFNLDSQSKLTAYAMAGSMLFGIIGFLLMIFGFKGKMYGYLKNDYGFDLERTLVSFIMPVTVGDIVSPRKVSRANYLIAYCEVGSNLRFVEILTNNNRVINTFELPKTAITKIRFAEQMGSTRCLVTISGLTLCLSDEIKKAIGISLLGDKSVNDEISVSTILSRNQWDTKDAIKVLNDFAARNKVFIEK